METKRKLAALFYKWTESNQFAERRPFMVLISVNQRFITGADWMQTR